jgi:hypothetical protein
MKVFLYFCSIKIRRNTNYKFIYLDDDKNSNNTDSLHERASSFLIGNYGPENPTIDIPVDDADLKHRQLARQNSISAKFRRQFEEIG